MKNCHVVHLGQIDAWVEESPVRYGWSLTDSGPTPKLMTQAAAPKKLNVLIVFQYQLSDCVSRACKCMKAGLLCLAACGCECDADLCENIVSLENQDKENWSDETVIMNE